MILQVVPNCAFGFEIHWVETLACVNPTCIATFSDLVQLQLYGIRNSVLLKLSQLTMGPDPTPDLKPVPKGYRAIPVCVGVKRGG